MLFSSIWQNSYVLLYHDPFAHQLTGVYQLLALEHTHRKRIVHRDVKPENVFIDNDGHVILGDFGLARKLRSKEDTVSIDDMFGTPAYTPPEIFTSEPYGREVDLWAFGVMLYELITGKVRFIFP
jgi:serine/threonine protein kinase